MFQPTHCVCDKISKMPDEVYAYETKTIYLFSNDFMSSCGHGT